MSGLFENFKQTYQDEAVENMFLQEYLEEAKTNPSVYASAQERLLKVIGEPKLVETQSDPRLSRIFQNRILRVYPAFEEEFFGIEPVIENMVSFITRAAQGLHEERQILYLLGPTGGGKSSLVEKLKELMEKEPFYTIRINGQISPVFESPLGLFSSQHHAQVLEENYGVPRRKIPKTMSPWAAKRLNELEGDLSKIEVVKMYPSILHQRAICKTEPADPNNQDTSTLVGKVSIRSLEDYDQNDPDAYSYSGGLCMANQGILEFVEMFKADIKTLNPLLTATQERNYKGTEAISAIPFNGLIIAHSNENEWQKFRNDPKNEAFIDRISLVKVPYTLRVTEESYIYQKMLRESELINSPCAPGTIRTLAKFSVLTCLKDPGEGSTWRAKMRVYDGENLKDIDPKAKPIHEYQDKAGVTEGMDGCSTRFAFETLSTTFNFDPYETAADPLHLIYVLQEAVKHSQFPAEIEDLYLNTFIKGIIIEDLFNEVDKELRTAYLESYVEYGQNIFENYVMWADHWISDTDCKNQGTGIIMDREALDQELSEIEKPAGIANPKDFRHEIVNYVLRERANNNGRIPDWRSYEKIREVIEKKMFSHTEDMLPVISFEKKSSQEDETEHQNFVQRMIDKGYTENQVKRLVDWYKQVKKSR